MVNGPLFPGPVEDLFSECVYMVVASPKQPQLAYLFSLGHCFVGGRSFHTLLDLGAHFRRGRAMHNIKCALTISHLRFLDTAEDWFSFSGLREMPP